MTRSAARPETRLRAIERGGGISSGASSMCPRFVHHFDVLDTPYGRVA